MRQVKITGTPPADWIAEADAVTTQLLAAEAITLDAAHYALTLYPNLTKAADVLCTGISCLAISEVVGKLFLRVFDGGGQQIHTCEEAKHEADDSPLTELKAVLNNNWVVGTLKHLELCEIFRLATVAVRRSATTAIIDSNEALWRDERIRNWLLSKFNNKCWYSEAQESVSSYHVDHYRPKGRTKDDTTSRTCRGFWWLAFNWKNYRICGQLLNVKKLDEFPLSDAIRGNHTDPRSIDLESPVLIDPRTEDARLISFDLLSADSCEAVAAGAISQEDEDRAKRTIEILGLNRIPRLSDKRAKFWNNALFAITEFKSATGKQPLRQVYQASARAKLKAMIAYDVEFSSVAEACVRKNAPEPLLATVFDR